MKRSRRSCTATAVPAIAFSAGGTRRASRPWVAALLCALLCALLVPVLAAAQHVGPYVPPPPDAATVGAASARAAAAVAAAPHIAESYGLAPLAELGDAAVEARDRLEAVRVWNESHRLPVRNGFERPLPAPRRLEVGAGDLGGGAAVERAGGLLVETAVATVGWGGMVRVAGAHRLRLHLAAVRLPDGARLWVHGAGRTAAPFGKELIADDGGLWTPSVGGEEAALDVELPAAALGGGARFGFTIDRVAELIEIGGIAQTAAKDTSCNVDASCKSSSDFSAIDTARHAVALIEFVDSGFAGQCTGQLLNDSRVDQVPYMLTANHCISTPGGARSLEAFWDYVTPSCNADMPALGGQATSNGATLLVTANADNSSDYTLMRLNSIPGGRAFLGWNADPGAVPDGTLLFRLSHPLGQTQNYNVTRVDSHTVECPPQLPPNFVYSDLVTGGTFGGSSGSAAMLANGEVVGQLYGGCGNDNDCSPLQATLDGAFAHSFPALQPYLQPGGGGGPTPCVADAATLCLLGRRFQVQVTWMNQFNGASGAGGSLVGTDTTGYFYFTDPSNFELIVKILNFGSVIKVFYAELTNLHFTITVTDSKTGTVKTYSNTPGDCGAIDESAFAADTAGGGAGAAGAAGKAGGAATQPAAAVAKRGTCVPGGGTLCLLDRRFAVTSSWMNQFNGASGQGSPRSLSDQTGLFSFTDPSVLELVLKVVPFSDRVAFFYGALSDFEYDLTVTDTVGGTTKTYHNAAGNYCGGLDNSAFPP
jgi:hypothetical protein